MTDHKPTVITISGLPGAGTTTLAKNLAELTGFEAILTGEIFRQLARDRDLKREELETQTVSDHSIDQDLDNLVQRKALSEILNEKSVIVEGRLAAHNFPVFHEDTCKIYLQAPIERYRTIYGIDVADLSCYDLVLSSENNSPEQLASSILKVLQGGLWKSDVIKNEMEKIKVGMEDENA